MSEYCKQEKSSDMYTKQNYVKVCSHLSKEGYSFLNFITAVFKNRKISWDTTWNETDIIKQEMTKILNFLYCFFPCY